MPKFRENVGEQFSPECPGNKKVSVKQDRKQSSVVKSQLVIFLIIMKLTKMKLFISTGNLVKSQN